MELLLRRGADISTTSARVFVRSDTNGVLTAVCNGATHTGDTLATGTDDGTGSVDITGLSANTEYSADIQVGGVSGGTINVKTAPVAGSTYNVLWSSCMLVSPGNNIRTVLSRYDPLLFFSLGDMPYVNSNNTRDGVTAGTVNTETTYDDTATYEDHHEVTMRVPGIKKIGQSCGYSVMANDHEYAFDNFPDISRCKNNSAGATWLAEGAVRDAWCDDSSNFDDIRNAAVAAHIAYTKGNPRADTETLYYSLVIGDCTFFMLDENRYRSENTDTDDASKSMLGATQKAWLKAGLSAATTTFKAIVSPYRFYETSPGKADSWVSYTTERDELVDYIYTEAITGVFVLSGDEHYSGVCYNTASSKYLLDVCACPLSLADKAVEPATEGTMPDRTIWWDKSVSPYHRTLGVLKISGSDYVELSIVSSTTGKPRWTGRINAGSNEIVTTRPKIS